MAWKPNKVAIVTTLKTGWITNLFGQCAKYEQKKGGPKAALL
jgi:hypothetical protein